MLVEYGTNLEDRIYDFKICLYLYVVLLCGDLLSYDHIYRSKHVAYVIRQ